MEGARSKKVKGVILAGGLGTRLAPLTRITNKHLLPVHNKPMILYPLDTLKKSGIDEIMIVCGREHAGHFMNFLGSGKEYGVSVSYAIQDINNGGIADALSYTEDFADEGPIAVILGDNIFETHFAREVSEFKKGATVFFKEVADPRRFGVPVFDEHDETIIRIEEKPVEPKSKYAQTGFYIYDETVFAKLKNLKPSARGELEITDVNNMYLNDGFLTHGIMDGFWSDAGTFESLLRASIFMANEAEKGLDFSKVLTIGASGMIGSYVDFGLRPDSATLNILDADSVSEYVKKHSPSAIIHLAGATDMSLTETNQLYAYELNVRGTYNVAKAASEAGIPMVYVSTSRVFKGDKEGPYSEEDTPEPQTQYARTKYLGEVITSTLTPKHLIVRTSWVFGGGKERDNKFYGNILRQLDKAVISALNDVHGSPTYGKDLITTIKKLLSEGQTGIVHIANEGVATRYDLAHHMIERVKPEIIVKGVDRSFFSSAATLPTNESISSTRCTLRPWQEALSEYLDTEWKAYLQSSKTT
jgi:glucose-1-phosphate thymidylyltransferase